MITYETSGNTPGYTKVGNFHGPRATSGTQLAGFSTRFSTPPLLPTVIALLLAWYAYKKLSKKA